MSELYHSLIENMADSPCRSNLTSTVKSSPSGLPWVPSGLWFMALGSFVTTLSSPQHGLLGVL